MEFSLLTDSDLFPLVVIPVLIFVARILDVTMGTMRIIFISRGMKNFAPFIAFFEALIWLLAITQIMRNLTNVANYVAFALGYASGTFVGIQLENFLAMGNLIVRVITRKSGDRLVGSLRKAGYAVTELDAIGEKGEVKIVFAVVKRKMINDFVTLIKKFNPNAFYTIEDLRFVSESPIVPIAKKHLFPMRWISGRK